MLVAKFLEVVAKFVVGESAPEERLSNKFGWLGEDDRLLLLLVSGSLSFCMFLFCRDLVVGGIKEVGQQRGKRLCLWEK